MVIVIMVGNVYIADFDNNRVRKLTVSTGIISLVAGTGSITYSGDGGLATSAGLNLPAGVIVDSSGTHPLWPLSYVWNGLFTVITFVGNVYICDEYNGRVRKVTISTGIISTIAGVGTSTTSLGDGGAATSARLYNPTGVALDSSGNLVTNISAMMTYLLL